MPAIDYSRFDGIGDDSSQEGSPRRAELATPSAAASAPPSTGAPSTGAPSNVMDDLEDYFRRLDERRRQAEDAAAPPSVDRFTDDEINSLPTFVHAATSSYEECAVCLSDFTEGEVLTRLPCAAAHVLRPACAQAWLRRSVYCPLCRVDLRAILPSTRQDAPPTEGNLSPRAMGFTRDGGRILRYEPNPPPEVPRPDYVPAHLREQASIVEIEYPERGVARVWRVPRHAEDDGAEGGDGEVELGT